MKQYIDYFAGLDGADSTYRTEAENFLQKMSPCFNAPTRSWK